MKFIIRLIIIAVIILILPKFIPGIAVSSFYYALLASIGFAMVNLLIKPLIGLITLPINILTLGLFGLVVNAVLFWIVAGFIPGFDIASFTAAFLGALAVTVANWLASHL